MRKEFLDRVQSVLGKIASTTYKRVDETILWVGASDEELNRTIDLSFENSLRIQIGNAMNYFEEREANEEKVLALFVRTLSAEVTETQFCKGDKVLKTEFHIKGTDGIKDIGLSSSLLSLINKADSKTYIKHPPVLNEQMFNQLNQELKKAYNTV